MGHAVCTAIAVIGGKIVAQRISVRTGEMASEFTLHFAVQQEIMRTLFCKVFTYQIIHIPGSDYSHSHSSCSIALFPDLPISDVACTVFL